MARFPAGLNSVKVEMFCNSAADSSGVTWRDISADVKYEDQASIQIHQGRPDETSEAAPSSCSFTLKDLTGTYSRRNPSSPYYGYLTQGTPIRVRTRCEYETFTTTGVDTWGSTPDGDTWSYLVTGSVPAPTSANFDKSGGSGTIVVPAATNVRLAYLAAIAHADVDVEATISFGPASITGAESYASIAVRGVSTSDYVQMRLSTGVGGSYTVQVLDQSGNAITPAFNVVDEPLRTETSAPLVAYASGKELRCRVVAYGPYYAAKVWPVTNPEPSIWSMDNGSLPRGNTYATNRARGKYAGWVGLGASTNTGSTNANMTVTFKDFVVRSPRFVGEISNLQPSRDATGNYAVVAVEASGILRRLSQGQEMKTSALRQTIPYSRNLIGYWPLEDGEAATEFSSVEAAPQFGVAYTKADPLAFQSTQTPDLAANSEIISSGPLPTYDQAAFGVVLPDYPSTGDFALRFVLKIPDAGDITNSVLARVWGTGTARLWQVLYTTGGNLVIEAYDRSVANIFTTSTPFAVDGKLGRVSMELVQNGANVDWRISYYQQYSTAIATNSGTTAGRTIGKQTYIDFNPFNTLTGTVIGHITAQSDFDNFNDLNEEFNAYKGELAGNRIGRMCGSDPTGIGFFGADVLISGYNYADFDSDFTATMAMGAQVDAGLLSNIRECSTTDMGTLHDSRSMDESRLLYRTRSSIYNQTAVVSLNMGNGEISTPWGPTDDDQLLRNAVIASNKNGGEYTAELSTGPLSTLPASQGGVGRYESSYTVNASADNKLPDIAGFQLALGTVDEYRFPTLAVNLANANLVASGKVNACLDVGIDDYVAVTNAIKSRIYDTIKQLARGYTESISQFHHKIVFNCSPETPYEGFKLDATTGFIDDTTTTLYEAITSGQTTIKVVSDTATWSNSASSGNLMVGGERMSSTGAATLAGGSFVASGAAAHANNASVVPALPAGHTAGDLLLILAGSRGSLANTPTGYTLLLNSSNLRIFGKIDGGSESAPTVSPASSVANSDFSAQMACFRNVDLGLSWIDNTPAAPAGNVGQLNGSAQNIAFVGQFTDPGNPQLVVCAGWKQDDMTSTTTRSGATKIADLSTTTGDDQSLTWDYQFCDGISAGSVGEDWTVTGGAAAISRSGGVTFRCIQTISVGRSVNGVTKAHVAGTPVHVADPIRLLV